MGTLLNIATASAVVVTGLAGVMVGGGISFAPTRAIPVQLSYTNLPTWSGPGTHFQPLSPGVYVSKPYSMIVAVPGNADPQMAVAPRDNAPVPMPTLSPEMHFKKIAP